MISTTVLNDICNDDKYPTTLVNSDGTMFIEGPIIIRDNTFKSLFTLHNISDLIFYDYVEFSENTAYYMIVNHVVHLLEHVVINVTRNNISILFNCNELLDPYEHIPVCYFQFFANSFVNKTSNTSKAFKVIIEDSKSASKLFFNLNAQNVNCKMVHNSMFYKHNPLLVYSQFIYYQTDLGQLPFPFDTGYLCYCLEGKNRCNINHLGPIFPGQTLSIDLCINQRFVNKYLSTYAVLIDMYDVTLPQSHCKVPLLNRDFNWITANCTKFHYTLLSNNEQQCELFLNAFKYKLTATVFYIKLLPCPMGFSFDVNTEKCECDPMMQSKLLTIINCDINNQAVLRPANSWLTAETYNNSYTYHMSPNCPFITVYHNHHNLISPLLIHNVNLIGLVYCVGIVNKI